MRKGQALVETALIAPLLIFMLIGVFEVGWALRSYLVLTNASREATRFAIRPNYLTYDETGYQKVVSHTFITLSGQLEFDKYGTEIISVISIDTQWVCDPDKILTCNCHDAVTSPYSQTLVMTPLTQPTLTYKYPITSTKTTRLNFIELVDELVPFEREFNCNLMKHGKSPAIDTMIYVELFYDQPQLFGFPLISNPLTDPVPMYGHTVMRKILLRE